MRWVFVVLLLLITVLVLVVPVTAQDGAEHEALLDRFVAGIEREEIYFSYATLIQTDFKITSIVRLNAEQNLTASQRTLSITDGYVIQTDNQESRSGTVDIVYDYRDPDTRRSYHVLADLIFMGETLYVSAEYVDNTGDMLLPEAGWRFYSSFEEVPEPVQLLDLPVVFKLETYVFQAHDLLVGVVDRAELEKTELIDGTPVDEITLWIDEEKLDTFFSVLIQDDPDEELLNILMEQDNFSGEISMLARFNDDDDILETELRLNLTMDNIPLQLVDTTAPEGSTMKLVITFSQYGLRDSINTEFAPIEPPR